jgi:uncharacterized membrane protein YkvA (DUF1232 family)
VKIFRLLATTRHELPRIAPLFRDGRVPAWSKVLAVLVALLIVSPIDVLGDIPILGFFDDAALLLFVMHTFVRFAERRAHVGAGAIVVN